MTSLHVDLAQSLVSLHHWIFYAGLDDGTKDKEDDISIDAVINFMCFEISVKDMYYQYACMWQMRMQSSAQHCFFD